MAVRLNITMDDDVYARLKKQVPPKKPSSFISAAVRAKLLPVLSERLHAAAFVLRAAETLRAGCSSGKASDVEALQCSCVEEPGVRGDQDRRLVEVVLELESRSKMDRVEGAERMPLQKRA
ncbi:hypothetical protein NITMOv2_3284 [Nitrospira moscoviensis]|uniref:Uncharacterized protein n=1 Tax=Nitrospira moscoviensis TaxID=42253 RepID=A0A0K2GGC3_NITMO|nr:hypothetical protein [Nitrospira moscoviensis]ALA59677.1 hypothetical protein NITMOv2_3284 [Nitrospira moscoviensis]